MDADAGVTLAADLAAEDDEQRAARADVEDFVLSLGMRLPAPAPAPAGMVRPDVAVIAMALHAAGLSDAGLTGAGLLVLSVPDAEWLKSVAECCAKHGALAAVRGPAKFLLQRVSKESDPRTMAAEALAGGQTAVLVEVSGDDFIPADVLRAADARLTINPLSWSDCRAVALRLSCDGRAPHMPAPDNIARLTPAAWALAYRSDQSASDLLARVVAVAGAQPPRAGIPALRLHDCPGMGEASAWGEDMAADLRAYAAGDLAWGELDRGALLYGPPGVGKTRFAACLAGSAGVPLVATSASEWAMHRSGHLNDFLSAMREAFARARAAAPCILFLDEVDSIGLRGAGDHNSTWTSGAVAGLLEALDGSDRREGVVVVAATNALESVEPALRRSGRLDRCIEVGLPDPWGLACILAAHLGNDLLHGNLLPIGEQGVGGTGADCERWVREARRRARVARRPLEMADLHAVVKPAAARASIGFNRY